MSKKLESGGAIESQIDSIMPIKLSEKGRQKIDGMKEENLKAARETMDIKKMEAIAKARDIETLRSLARNPHLPSNLVSEILSTEISFQGYTSGISLGKMNEKQLTKLDYVKVLIALQENSNPYIAYLGSAVQLEILEGKHLQFYWIAPSAKNISYKDIELVAELPLDWMQVELCDSSVGPLSCKIENGRLKLENLRTPNANLGRLDIVLYNKKNERIKFTKQFPLPN